MARPGGLGKGLGALIPAGTTDAGAALQAIPIASIQPNPQQPRQHFDEETLGSLAESIRELGVLQPVLVRATDDGFELIAGERRWRAARRAGLQTIPAIVRQADNAASLQQAIVENVQREQLNPLEEAAAYQQLIEDFDLTHDDVAIRVGKSRATITNTLRLLQLPTTVQRYLQDGSLRTGHARALLGTPDRGFQEQLARRAVAEELSVREVEEAVRARTESPATRAARERAPKLRPPGLLELEELLGDYLETRIRISMGPKHGTVQIDFATLEDLERIYRVMTDGSRRG
ncbi:MAG: ParB/RepB/Spo0J family partition protein [Actinomycetota bacterium]|nr:ParB/RepB/Spo0J family partition protein [Actinomycetota bacterium]